MKGNRKHHNPEFVEPLLHNFNNATVREYGWFYFPRDKYNKFSTETIWKT